MKNKKRLLRAGLALFAAFSFGLTEGEVPAPEITTEAITEATAAPGQEQTSAPEPTAAPTADIPASPSFLPSADPSVTASASPSAGPDAELTPEPVFTPPAEASAKPSLPPSAPDGLRPAHEEAELAEGIYHIPCTRSDETIAFVWPGVQAADSYRVILSQEYTDGDGNITESELYNEVQSGCRVEFTAEILLNGKYSLRVQALAAEALLSEEQICFRLTLEQNNDRPGNPSGGRPSGMGSMASSSAVQDRQQGFHVTPGEALTDDHASGTKDMRCYNTVEIPEVSEPVSVLELDESGLSLDGSCFTAFRQDDRLTCTPVSRSSTWTLSLRLLETLRNSGIATLALGDVELDTGITLSGNAFTLLRSRGYVSKDFIFTIDAAGIIVSVAGESYLIDADGALTPFGG